MTSLRYPPLSYDPPANDQIQIDVFGPGVGECVLVHLGAESWLMVDSCRGRGRSNPAALEYLETIGVGVAEAIRLIVATHWHDDHVRGISEVYEQASEAHFYVAGCIRPSEFLAITRTDPMPSRFTSGVDELARVANVAADRGVPVRSVGAAQRIHYSPTSPVSEIWTLSPSYEDLNISRHHIAALLPTMRPGSRRIPALEPNDTSVVLLLETALGGVLLGGDLEERPNTRTRGWHAVMDLDAAPKTRSSYFKLPHHGSVNAHCPEVWEHRIEGNAVCVVTPFDRGRSSLPRTSDRDRIRQLTSRGVLTSDKRDRPVGRDRTTLKTIRESTRAFAPQTVRMGHVQIRSEGLAWTVRASEEAVAV
jgi:hypothetical protein